MIILCQGNHANLGMQTFKCLLQATKVLAFILMSMCKVAYRQFKITYMILTYLYLELMQYIYIQIHDNVLQNLLLITFLFITFSEII